MKARAKSTDKDFDDLISYVEKYCNDARIKITVDRNPSPEKIAYIKERLRLTNESKNIQLVIPE